jgi:hypothetical protein
MTLEGAGAATTIIDGEGLGGVFHTGGSITTTISGVTIQNGQVSGMAGGGIWNTGKLILVNSAVISNTASSGGGIHNQEGVLKLIDSTVSDNYSGSGDGGGILNDYGGTVTLINSTVSNNHSDWIGGGISNQYYGTLILINSTVSENSAGSAVGGITADNESPVTLISSTVYSNTSSFNDPNLTRLQSDSGYYQLHHHR